MVGDALHAAARVVLVLGVVGRLLHLDDVAVAHERELTAGAGAVGGAGGAYDAVDGEGLLHVVAAGGLGEWTTDRTGRGRAAGHDAGADEELPAGRRHPSALPRV